MKKEILLIWFGDYEPIYAKNTIQNFQQMNSDWTITYVRYSTDQLKAYESIPDPILQEAIIKMKARSKPNEPLHFSYIADDYRDLYIKHAKNAIVATDLDVLPISKFDDFFRFVDFHEGCVYKYFPFLTTLDNKTWFTYEAGGLVSNCQPAQQPIMIYNKIDMTKNIISHFGCLMNEEQQQLFDERSRLFHENQLSLEKNGAFLHTKFFPIEHYYSWEREKTDIKLSNQINA